MRVACPLLSACLLLLLGASAEAATLRWTGLGSSALWSDAANWDGLRVPADGDALLFGGTTARARSSFDLTRSFASLVFAADAPAFSLHVPGSAAVLTFDGIGIRNNTAGSGPFRQEVFADGGSIVFSGKSGINLGDASSLRPVNLTARGGGHLVFQDDAATGASTYDALRAESGGDIRFSGRALATRSASITAASGAQASFSGMARADATFNVLAGDISGGGARADFSGRAAASMDASFYNQGATTAGAEAQAVTIFRNDATLVGSVNNEAGAVAGAYGGQLEFRNRASHDTVDIDPTLGNLLIRNGGATVAGARSGSTTFSDDSGIRGARLLIINAVQAEAADAGSAGGSTEFRDRGRAGQVSVINEGAARAGAGSGATRFSSQANAEGARIVNAPGSAAGTVGGTTGFSGQAVAGSAHLDNNARLSGSGGAGGSTIFSDDASAQQATISNQGGLTTGDNGSTRFRDRASAGQASIMNSGGQTASAFGGVTNFDGHASAGLATLVMAGGRADQALGGFAVFYADTSAGSATLDLRAASVLGATGGRALFFDRASAGAARMTVAGSPVDHVRGAEGGAVTFAGASSAGDAMFTVGGNRYAGGGVATLRFADGSTAAGSTITLAAGQTGGGALSFEGLSESIQASAGSARITNQGSSDGAARGLAIGGQTRFVAHSSAGSATISNGAGFGAGLTHFFAISTAADARLINLGGLAGEDGGTTQFNNSATAARAVIVNRAGARGVSGFDAAGVTRFVDQASAGQARITAEGASSSNAVGGLVTFNGTANPASATLIAEGGANGGAGGRIHFAGLTNASQAHVILKAGNSPGGSGEFDVSAVSVAGVAIGTLEGGGTVSLGSKRLTVWSNSARSSFSGLLRDGGVAGGSGGSLSVRGGATLTLTGANSYSGGTRIGDGINAGSGKLVAANTEGSATGTGDVLVERGGTLAGSGSVGGNVMLMDGGTIAPGDPVTLSLKGDLTWNGGGVVRLVLGADAAGSDHLVMHKLVRGSDGVFVFDLVDFGITAGGTYDLLQFDSMVGFTASDFGVSGLAGNFAVQNGRLGFTISAVPEPGTVVLWLMGLPMGLLVAMSAGAARRSHRTPRD